MATAAPPIVLPAPTFRSHSGHLDHATTDRYAARLADTWIAHVIVSGPMGRGEHCTPAERASLLDAWLRHATPERLIATCWTPDDVQIAQSRRVRPLVMLRGRTEDELVDQLDAAPTHSWVYANPRYSGALLTPEQVSAAAVSGVKLSKVTLSDLATMRIANPDAVIVHGSSRTIAASLTAGADLVTAAPLAALPSPWPTPGLAAIQATVDSTQRLLNELPTHHARVDWITTRAGRAGLACCP